MTTLRMNTDQARSTASVMQAQHGEIQSALSSLSSSVSTLDGEWMGNSATQFQTEFSEWRSQLGNLLNVLQELKNRLDAEIAEWEAAAAQL